jgi:RNA polymerase sigma factor (sigma-70 family)
VGVFSAGPDAGPTLCWNSGLSGRARFGQTRPMPADTTKTISAVWKIESARLIAGIARMVKDVGTAEDLAQEALIAALEHWPVSGIPDNPGAWLMATAKRRAIDVLRQRTRVEHKHAELGRDMAELEQRSGFDLEAALDDDVGDDLLRLVFTACHPVLSDEARVALTLRMLGGLTTDEIARAFLVPEPTIAQRIVRAKRTLAEAKVTFEAPRADELAERITSVLRVIYLVFNEGYSATAGEDWMRLELVEEALRLGRILVGLMPNESEVLGLVGLMEIQASRSAARTDAKGEPILLLDQNRALWNGMLIRRGLDALAQIERLGGSHGPYALQAAIAACHARAAKAEDTNWSQIVELYAQLLEQSPSAVIELNLAVAVAMAQGPAAGLVLVDRLIANKELSGYHLLPSVRGDLLFKLGRLAEAALEFERAESMTRNVREQRLLRDRAQACRSRA